MPKDDTVVQDDDDDIIIPTLTPNREETKEKGERDGEGRGGPTQGRRGGEAATKGQEAGRAKNKIETAR